MYRARTPHFKSHIPGGMVAVLACSYGRRVSRRNSLMHQARVCTDAHERRWLVMDARKWHKMAMRTLAELRAHVEQVPASAPLIAVRLSPPSMIALARWRSSLRCR